MADERRRKSTRLSAVLGSPPTAPTAATSLGSSRAHATSSCARRSSGANIAASSASAASRRSNNASSSSSSADVIPTHRYRGTGKASAAKNAALAAAPRLEDLLRGDDDGDGSRPFFEDEEQLPFASNGRSKAAAVANKGKGTASTATTARTVGASSSGRGGAAAKRKRGFDADDRIDERHSARSTSSRRSEVADGLHFVREERSHTAAIASSPNSRTAKVRGAIPYTSSRRIEELPSDVFGETPIANRNRARRAGLDGLGQPSSSSSSNIAPPLFASSSRGRGSSGGRRDSLGLKGRRRASSLRNGSIAHPHENVPDDMLYRHCSSGLDPVGRMKYILAWVLHRAIDSVFSNAPAASGAKKRKALAAKVVDEETLRKRKEMEPLLRRIMEQVIRDIDEQEVSVSWLGRPEKGNELTTSFKPHPRNAPNRAAEARLKAIGEAMQAEALAWESEKQDLEEYESITQHLEKLLREGRWEEIEELEKCERPGPSTLALHADEDEEAEGASSADEEESRLREEAQDAIEWAAALATGTMPDARKKAAAGMQSTKEKGKKKAAKLPVGVAELAGSEFDARWSDVEFNIDSFRQNTHSYTQLSQLVERYLRAVSSRATQALKDSSSAAAALAASSSDASGEKRKAQQDMANLMRGVNAHRNAIPSARAETQAGTAGAAPGDAAISSADTSDSLDPADLLRALANTGRSTRTGASGGSGSQRSKG
ncbi:hypothetical protein K437DRAFT_253823 [Tilletiaria anomala UBC 951]|uniref:Mis12-domain-containing protein n=1 Tax=Tilletiaria anomala (strain ATCC 24038 / CBS 436.72 / UBC 951) TaxID=1037660 RepID=A0A066WG04_TILAU|nr:uncharacterized protein K437DRAFT_253823 [Tilletiaria anomala UBC 951]KDN52877.1 hypothetical protein K437DRAFT_253823 [Tilletiaria anomala UBC 951]